MKNASTQKAKELKKEGKGIKANKAKIANLSPEDIKGITGDNGVRLCIRVFFACKEYSNAKPDPIMTPLLSGK